jgi:hypothetical protein
MAVQVIPYTEGDTSPDIDVDYKINGVAVDISAYQGFRLHVAYPSSLGGPLVKAGTLVNGPGGLFKFTWSAADLKPGRWPAEIQLTDAAGKVITFRELVLEVAKQIA